MLHPFKLFSLGMIVLACGASVGWAIDHTKEPLDKIKQQVAEKKAVLVDVREQEEWDKGHVEGAVLVPLGDLGKKSKDPDFVKELEKKIPKNQVVYCHCAKGKRAILAGDVLKRLGYDVRPLKPGYQELIDAGFPAAKQP
jgi:phage shock protein E